uniref:Uncharacterized protein n=1 Tax=Coccidioides posadasii RMSCC 3488 TaxID=454284 RepID=A0A0J6IGA5_COCPO|nr:hypothetical protein CPAG_07164 [Coccidioides posadasii RMSCC 3488]
MGIEIERCITSSSIESHMPAFILPWCLTYSSSALCVGSQDVDVDYNGLKAISGKAFGKVTFSRILTGIPYQSRKNQKITRESFSGTHGGDAKRPLRSEWLGLQSFATRVKATSRGFSQFSGATGAWMARPR